MPSRVHANFKEIEIKKPIAAVIGLVLLSGCSASSTKNAHPTPALTNATGGSERLGHGLSESSVPDSPPPTTSSATPFMLPAGATALIYAENGVASFTAKVTVASIVTTTRTVSSVANTPPRNGQYIVADISIQCTSQTPCYFDALDWDAVNPSGQSFSEALWTRDPALDSGELAAGRTVRGYVTIDSPTDVKELTYGGSSDPAASWTIR